MQTIAVRHNATATRVGLLSIVAQIAPPAHAMGSRNPAVTSRLASTHGARNATSAVSPKAAASATGPANRVRAVPRPSVLGEAPSSTVDGATVAGRSEFAPRRNFPDRATRPPARRALPAPAAVGLHAACCVRTKNAIKLGPSKANAIASSQPSPARCHATAPPRKANHPAVVSHRPPPRRAQDARKSPTPSAALATASVAPTTLTCGNSDSPARCGSRRTNTRASNNRTRYKPCQTGW